MAQPQPIGESLYPLNEGVTILVMPPKWSATNPKSNSALRSQF